MVECIPEMKEVLGFSPFILSHFLSLSSPNIHTKWKNEVKIEGGKIEVFVGIQKDAKVFRRVSAARF